ncbi:TIGR02594 family protein [Pararhodobacter sp.]|uniref:NlpC/P60 family protein n=1 Tax=Pararhodobacter sp. TaxID=2127056 RepID=UPI002AFF745C|nr:TIGR02594 family protein [Pararhodobacter sp.]
MYSIKNLQAQLIQLGYDLGPSGADGAFGRMTTAAVAQFQADYAVGVKWPGTVGEKTLAALNAAIVQKGGSARALAGVILPWYEEAKRLQGTKEIAGKASNPTIMGWAKKLGGWIASYYNNDDIPWCGLFLAHCIGATLPSETLPANPLGALNWAKFGVRCAPTLGAVLVFSRSGGGHVGIYVGEDAEAYHVLGGNQSNTVNITRVAKSRHVDTRWPATWPAPDARKIALSGSGKLSTNEA